MLFMVLEPSLNFPNNHAMDALKLRAHLSASDGSPSNWSDAVMAVAAQRQRVEAEVRYLLKIWRDRRREVVRAGEMEGGRSTWTEAA